MIEKAREQNADVALQRALNMFKCDKDYDIESFLHEKAIRHIERKTCNVYLVLDEDRFDNGEIAIMAYFTLSHRSIEFREDVSKTRIKDVAGFKDRTSTPVVLIGQLGKYISGDYSADISIDEILSYVFEVILAADELIPCRAALVECSEVIHKLQIYENAGFKFLQQDDEFYQYYKVIE